MGQGCWKEQAFLWRQEHPKCSKHLKVEEMSNSAVQSKVLNHRSPRLTLPISHLQTPSYLSLYIYIYFSPLSFVLALLLKLYLSIHPCTYACMHGMHAHVCAVESMLWLPFDNFNVNECEHVKVQNMVTSSETTNRRLSQLSRMVNLCDAKKCRRAVS